MRPNLTPRPHDGRSRRPLLPPEPPPGPPRSVWDLILAGLFIALMLSHLFSS